MKLRIFTILILSFLALKIHAELAVTNVYSFEFLKFNQIKSLLTSRDPDLSAVKKLGETFSTIFYSYRKDQFIPDSHIDKETSKRYVRVTQWNLANLDLDKFKDAYTNNGSEEFALLRETDIFTLNEVDFDTEGSNYQNVNEIFSKIVDGRYLFAAEFIEASPEILTKSIVKEYRVKKPAKKHIENNPYLSEITMEDYEEVKPESEKTIEDFKGLHGNAIVSKFPIKSARILRLPACYDWFREEDKLLKKDPEERERKEAKNRAGEGTIDLIRRGGRLALIAEIVMPNRSLLTVVSTELENRADPECREEQMEALLEEIKTIRTPLVIGADMNNFEKNMAPSTISETVVKTVTNPEILVKKVINYFNPFIPITTITSLTYGNYRKKGDPTVKHVPIFLKNEAYGLFNMISEYQFNDGTKFDFSGEEKLENTNERAGKGFETTYEYKKLIGNGKVKLDWIFVKPLEEGDKETHYSKDAQTLTEINLSKEMEKHSFHYPTTIKIVM